MKNFEITTSSTCDLNVDILSKNNINYVRFNYQVDGKMFKDDFYKEVSPQSFFSDIANHEVMTSQPSPDDYVELWEQIVSKGNDVLHIELSSGISGAYNSSLIARDVVKEKYPDSNIEIVDSLCASAGLGILVLEAIDKKNDFDNVKDFFEYLDKFKHNINHIFISADLSQFFKGGRISKTSFVVGKLLNIVPVMSVDENGKLYIVKKARSVNNALKEIDSLMSTTIIDGDNYNHKILLSHSDCMDYVDKMLEILKPKYINANVSNENVFNIGLVIGSHTGKGTLAVFFVGNGRNIN